MKRKGATSDFATTRNEELYQTFIKVVSETTGILNLNDLCAKTAEKPSSRFWVSENRASDVIRKIDGINAKRRKIGLPPFDISNSKRRAMLINIALGKSVLPQRSRMYLEIYDRYLRLREEFPNMPTNRLVGMVIEQPAPSFFLTASGTKRIVTAIRNSRRFNRK